MASREYYLRTVCNQITTETIQDSIVKELSSHIEDQTEAYIAEGLSKAEAEEAAVEEMGDPVEVGTMLNEIHKPKPVKKYVIGMMLVTGILFCLNLYTIFTEKYEYHDGYRSWNILVTMGLVVFVGWGFGLYMNNACGRNLRIIERRRPFSFISSLCAAFSGYAIVTIYENYRGIHTPGLADFSDPLFLSLTLSTVFIMMDSMICERRQKFGCVKCFFRGVLFIILTACCTRSFFFTAEVSLMLAAIFTSGCRRNWFPTGKSFVIKKIVPYLLWIAPVFCVGGVCMQIAEREIRIPITLSSPSVTWEYSYLSAWYKKVGILPAYAVLAAGIAVEIFLIKKLMEITSEYGRLFFLAAAMILGILLINGILTLYGFLPERYLFTPFLWKLMGPLPEGVDMDFFQLLLYYTTAGYITRFTSREKVLDLELSPLPDRTRRRFWGARKYAEKNS